MQDKLIRIGVFYDGNYFFHVSNYYNYEHPRKKRLSISGLHDFIRNQVAQEEGEDVRYCQIVDAHYFRGRLSAQEALQRGTALYWDRVFDDILMSEGVITHYLPVKNVGGKREEKGIDVWLALEAFELAIYKRFDVIVLVASDGDYVPLLRKLNTIGTRVMVLGWDFEYTTEFGSKMITRTSQELFDEATYPIPMQEIIDGKIKKNDLLINNLFVIPTENRKTGATPFVPNMSNMTNLMSDEMPMELANMLNTNSNYTIPTNTNTANPPVTNTTIPVNNNGFVPPVTTNGVPPQTVQTAIPTYNTPLPNYTQVPPSNEIVEALADGTAVKISEILSIKNGYGFIKFPPNNLFFHHSNVVGGDFNELREGDSVQFLVDEEKKDAAKAVMLIR